MINDQIQQKTKRHIVKEPSYNKKMFYKQKLSGDTRRVIRDQETQYHPQNRLNRVRIQTLI